MQFAAFLLAMNEVSEGNAERDTWEQTKAALIHHVHSGPTGFKETAL